METFIIVWMALLTVVFTVYLLKISVTNKNLTDALDLNLKFTKSYNDWIEFVDSGDSQILFLFKKFRELDDEMEIFKRFCDNESTRQLIEAHIETHNGVQSFAESIEAIAHDRKTFHSLMLKLTELADKYERLDVKNNRRYRRIMKEFDKLKNK